MTMIVDITNGYDGIAASYDGTLIRCIKGQMTYLPSCCSVGIAENFGALLVKEQHHKALADKPRQEELITHRFKDKVYMHELIGCIGGSANLWPFPEYVGRWYLLSKILLKCTSGKDDSGDNVYGNYKASSVVLFDRYNPDKDPKLGFKFQYNQNMSVDHVVEWLSTEGMEMGLGEILTSTPVPGAHKARVRGCIFTPDVEALQHWHDARFPILKEHMLDVTEYYYNSHTCDKAKGPEGFVGY